ncbi:flagellar basal body-associated FliL family protein [[Clostridium] fimetarium]|uniref:Flagellar protein FliL n=1 Tax=[Clostridium] fimetarium TaxID=99656 RepID=A0A1I0N258_9FIRM|nr:hypothetical protein [[Clostridium] fimetarium]SEV94827.1 hypothetical protein SAMN05421659_102312 [[Clostridium] fimetarium]
MKKSFLNVITLALVLINLILTVLLTFSLVSTSQKTDDFISKIAGIIDLDVGTTSTGATHSDSTTVGIGDLEVIDVKLSDGTTKITISLLDDAGKVHQSMVSVALSLNKNSKDYTKLRANVDNGMNLIVSEVNKVVSSYSFNVVLSNKANMEQQILTYLQDTMFQSDIVYSVSFTGLVVQ